MPKIKTFLILALISSLAVSLFQINTADTKTLEGYVVGVHDGDTLTLLTSDKTQVKIRLEGIDAPELNQPFGQKAKSALSDLVFTKKIKITMVGKDPYQRILGRVFVEKVDVNLELIRLGFAWHYVKYSDDPSLKDSQATAQKAGLGLWAVSDAVAPWEWRSSLKENKDE